MHAHLEEQHTPQEKYMDSLLSMPLDLSFLFFELLFCHITRFFPLT